MRSFLKPALFYIFLSLTAGIIAGNFFPEFKSLAFTGTLVFLFLNLLFYFYDKTKIFIFILGFTLSFSFFAIQVKLYPILPLNHISNYLDAGKNVITGKIVSFTRHYEKKYKVVVLCQTIQIKNHKKKKVTGKINLTMYKLSHTVPEFGDTIKFNASIRSLRNFMNPGAFDYARFLKLQDIYGTSYVETNKIQILDNTAMGFKSKILRSIEKLRNNFYYFVTKQTNHSKAGKIIVSLVTGKKEVISHDLRDIFSKAGTSHLLAISGLHLSIVSFLFYFVFFKFLSLIPALLISGRSKKIAGILTIFPLLSYAFFTGFSPSTQRALIMIIVFLFGYICEKENDVIVSLSAAGILILIIDPSALFSISFQLSFMAVIFIIYGISLSGGIKLFQIKNNFAKKIFLMICVTFFAGLGTSPLTAHYFNMISVIAVISNFIFIPIIGFMALPLGLIALGFFLISPWVAGLIISICEKLISFTITLSQTLISIPFSWSRTITLQWIEIIAIYLIFMAVYFIFKGHKKRFILFVAMFFLLAIFNFSNFGNKKINPLNLDISIIDVGQGNSAFIQTAGKKNILVDAGGFSGSSSFDTGRFIVAPYLWKKRITTLDYVILSHPEADHLNGLIFILQNFKVHTLIKNQDTKNSKSYNMLIKTCEEKNIKIYNPSSKDDKIDLDHTKLIFFNHTPDAGFYNLNNNSLVLKLVYNDFSMLFPGDILRPGEKRLADNPNVDLNSNVLLAPHHGSITSSSKLLLDKVGPKSVVISCGWRNRYGFPHFKVLQRYDRRKINIFRTDEKGMIFISSNGKGYIITTHKG